MLDNKIKNAIDKARDVLVGKIPAPNTQVEQITIAMLYKFMDDMDYESIDFGGKAKFFTGDYEKFSWKNIMSNKIGAQERFNLYVEALEKFYIHPELPQTFKDIFKNATVPYRDADILTMFLKVINSELSYADSEQLGDAYEYLLSVLGSQGDLGQFRTPRHIIDFIVSIVDPKSNETVLDPACGTAGFLISAYKHILKQNTNKKIGDKLNYEQKLKILDNITGYDIEPSMVRIAEMNMFLHGATDPNIYEYDTLTMDYKWEDKFDIILANPPFMTPKGGIKPHSKYSVKATKSEILFVDYISNHIKSNGRAGVIVPNGVVFGSKNAYLSVRNEILEESLWAVISLPNGIFQPYSGVGTCILLLDKALAKTRDSLVFVEVNNDGYSLGKQRNIIQGNEIPQIIDDLKKIKENQEVINKNITIVKKEIVVANNYDLSINKYKKVEQEKIDYGSSEEIYAEIENLEKSIQEEMKKIKGMI